MPGRRRSRPRVEALESRLSPVGFYEGPAPVPVQLFLQGMAQGVAVIRPARPGGGMVVTLLASGPIAPVGHARLSGTIRISGGFEQGRLTLNSPLSSITLAVAGPVAPVPGPEPFEIVQGQGVAVNTTYAYQREFGSGTVVIALGPGSGRVPISLAFGSRP